MAFEKYIQIKTTMDSEARLHGFGCQTSRLLAKFNNDNSGKISATGSFELLFKIFLPLTLCTITAISWSHLGFHNFLLP